MDQEILTAEEATQIAIEAEPIRLQEIEMATEERFQKALAVIKSVAQSGQYSVSLSGYDVPSTVQVRLLSLGYTIQTYTDDQYISIGRIRVSWGGKK